jgi:hypothetical protein
VDWLLMLRQKVTASLVSTPRGSPVSQFTWHWGHGQTTSGPPPHPPLPPLCWGKPP